MQILVVNQYFHPDRSATSQLLTELCEDLAEHHDVTVVCGRPSYDPSEQREVRGFLAEDRHGRIRVLRSWSTTYSRTVMAGRLINYATYLTSCILGAMWAAKPDVVLTMTDPPIVAVAAAVASAARRAPFVYVNQDVFPEVGVALGRIRDPTLVRSLAWLNRSLRRRAACVVAIGRDMERALVALGSDPERIEVIQNWADGDLIRPLVGPSRLKIERGWRDRFVVMHSGNVGLSQDLGTLIAAADLLRDESDIVFAIVGEGASKAALVADVALRGLTNVEFLPYQPKEELADSLGAADLHIVGLKSGLSGYIVPSKVYGILAAGKPYVAAVEPRTEPALIAEEHGCGVRVEPGDPGALAAAIREMQGAPLDEMGTNAREALEGRFERSIATESYRRLLEALGRRRPIQPA
jgi:glycosyltransferase involved in cell wall biosynthesis